MTLATRIVVMRAGRIQQEGAPAEVYERPANLFVAGFLGAPAMNFVRGALDDGGRFSAGTLALDMSAALAARGARPAVLGIRPEHVAIAPGAPLAGSVTLVEPMGNHQVVWIEAGGQQLSAIVHDQRGFAVGQEVRFGVDASRVSLFDPDSEQRL
jgi:multiple sugar transport system ATP-binding protein